MPGCCGSKPIIWVLGCTATGKTTQSEMIVGQYGYAHLSTADLIQEEIKNGADEGSTLTAIMKSGEPVSADIMVCLLMDAIQATSPCCPGFVIDGFPRNIKQAQAFEKKIGPPRMVIYFDASDDVLIARLLNRAACFGNANIKVNDVKKQLKPMRNNFKKVLSSYKRNLVSIKIDGRTVYDIYGEVQEAFSNAC